jgi:hypothetical protein
MLKSNPFDIRQRRRVSYELIAEVNCSAGWLGVDRKHQLSARQDGGAIRQLQAE